MFCLSAFCVFPEMFSKVQCTGRGVRPQDHMVKGNIQLIPLIPCYCCLSLPMLQVNSLPNNKVLDSSKFLAFIDNKINMTEQFENLFWEGLKTLLEKEKMLVTN